MNVLILVSWGIAAFLLGFAAGVLFPPGKRVQPSVSAQGQEELSAELQKLRAEYRNFLDYDGSDQT